MTIEHIAPGAETKQKAAERLVEWAEENGRLRDLYVALSQFTDTPTTPPATIPEPAPQPRWGIDEHVPFLNFQELVNNLTTVGRTVCMIRYAGRPLGTGFLVGEDLVLTAYHTLRAVIDGRDSPGEVSFLFDYSASPTGAISAGMPVKLTPRDWCVDYSPYAPLEAAGKADEQLPTEDQLDYVLVRLETPLGAHAWSNDRPNDRRGFLRLSETPKDLYVGQPLMILQHPEGQGLKLSISTKGVQSINMNGTRVRYSVMTMPGSSGAPCLDLLGNLLALHHFSGPEGKFKQGIPIRAIVERLCRVGKADYVRVKQTNSSEPTIPSLE